MAEESTTGASLYDVGTGVIGDFSVEARANAMDRFKEEGLERKRQKDLNQKKSDKAYSDLSKLKSGGWRHHDTYLKGDRDKISKYLETGFQQTDGKLFSGEGGQKKQLEYQTMLTDYNNRVEYSNQIKSQVEKQQALMAEGADKYTPESIKAHDNFMNMSADQQFKSEIPSLQLKVDPVMWEDKLISNIPGDMFIEKDIRAGSHGTSSSWKLNEDEVDAHVDQMINTAFTPGAGNKMTDGMVESMTALFEEHPNRFTLSTVPDEETGISPYEAGLRDFSRNILKAKIISTRKSGQISKTYRDSDSGKKVEETIEAPVRTEGGVQMFDAPEKDWAGKPTEVSYQSEATVEFDSGDKAYRTVNAPVAINLDGSVDKRSGNTILPKEGGVIQYGYKISDLTKEQQKSIRAAGIEGETVDMLRIEETSSSGGVTAGQRVGGSTKTTKTVLLPITESLDNGMSKASGGYVALKNTSTSGGKEKISW